MLDYGYTNKRLHQLEMLLAEKYRPDELKLVFAGFIVSYFQKRNKWSGKGMIVHSVLFNDGQLIVKYSSVNGHTEYKRMFFDRHVDEIMNFINTNNLDMSTKQLYNDRLYNSFDTIIHKKDIVVIQYLVDTGFSTLLSMTVGDFYVAEKVVHEGIEKYALLSHNKMDRSGTDTIKVHRVTTGSSVKRFAEHRVAGWIEQNDFDNRQIVLCPVISGYNYIDPMTGKLHCVSNQIIISTNATSAQLQHNLGMRPGFSTLWSNTFGAKNTNEIGTITGTGTTHNQIPGAILINNGDTLVKWQKMSEDATKKGVELHIQMEKMLTGKETDADIEKRLDSVIPTVRRHRAEPNIGVKDDYLLIN